MAYINELAEQIQTLKIITTTATGATRDKAFNQINFLMDLYVDKLSELHSSSKAVKQDNAYFLTDD